MVAGRTPPDPWIAFRKPNPRARLRLFCFSYAGGGASVYRTWHRDLPSDIEVCPVQIPGREGRLKEKRFLRVEPLVTALVEALGPYLDMPFAFFGHSLGAIVAYELALTLRAEEGKSPVCLLVSARRAPQVPPDEEPIYALPPDQFHAKLREFDGTPAEVLDHPELMELLEPLLRADFELNDTYESTTEKTPLDCPITAFGGLEDKDVDRDHLEAWREMTTGPFRMRMFPGGHFYLHQGQQALIAAVAQELMPLVPLA